MRSSTNIPLASGPATPRQQLEPDSPSSSDAYRRERGRYLEALIDQASATAFPEFASGLAPEPIYEVRDRHGVSIIVLAADAMNASQRLALRRFQFAQYLEVGFLDPDVVFGGEMDHEPPSPVERSTIYSVAFSSRDGRLLATLALRGIASAPGTTLRSPDRPLLPVEHHFGPGALNRLRLLPDLPLARVREIGSFARNQRLGAEAELGIRGAVEVCVAMARALTDALSLEVEAFVGEFEDAVARRNLEYLHTPMAVLRGGLPAVELGHHQWPGLVGHARYPFAVLVSDMAAMAPRLAAIERALSEPGQRGLRRLLELKSVKARPTSSLVPAGGIPSLANAESPQCDLPSTARLDARRRGRQLRSFAPLRHLSETEATTLGGLVETRVFERGDTILRRGDPSDALYLICRGEAEVCWPRGGPAVPLGDGECFGEIGVLTGTARTADVTARSQVTVFRVERDTYLAYLRGLADVDSEFRRIALSRAVAQLQTRDAALPATPSAASSSAPLEVLPNQSATAAGGR